VASEFFAAATLVNDAFDQRSRVRAEDDISEAARNVERIQEIGGRINLAN
jgi:hypothetical protein